MKKSFQKLDNSVIKCRNYVSVNRSKLHAMTKSWGGMVFEALGKCSFRVMMTGELWQSEEKIVLTKGSKYSLSRTVDGCKEQ